MKSICFCIFKYIFWKYFHSYLNFLIFFECICICICTQRKRANIHLCLPWHRSHCSRISLYFSIPLDTSTRRCGRGRRGCLIPKSFLCSWLWTVANWRSLSPCYFGTISKIAVVQLKRRAGGILELLYSWLQNYWFQPDFLPLHSLENDKLINYNLKDPLEL